jgi:hypothetical protein
MQVFVEWAPYLAKRYIVLNRTEKGLELLNGSDNQRIHVKESLASTRDPSMGFLDVTHKGVRFICSLCRYEADLTAESGTVQDSFCKEHNRLLHSHGD